MATASLSAAKRRLIRSTAIVAMATAALYATPAMARCSNANPVDGETVTCDTSAPSPDVTGVGPLTTNDATVLPTGVTVNILTGASISLPGTVGFPVIRLGQGANVNLAAGSLISTANGGGIAISFNPNRASANSIVDVAGSITSRGTGISFSGPAATITLRQGGSITSGTVANGGNPGIFISPTGTSLTNVQIDGAITLLGNTGVGTGAVQSLTATGSRATITLGTTGTINTSGTNALGIIAQGPSNTVNIAGTITTSGAAASGVVAIGSATDTTRRLVNVSSTGRISTSGDNAAGIVFGTVDGVLGISAGGEVRTTGTGNAAAVFLLDAASSATNISNDGSLIATNALGVRGVGSLSVTNRGTISGTTGLAVIAGPSAASDIFNLGTITGTGGVAVDMRLATGDFRYSILSSAVTNGTVLGGTGVNTLRFHTFTGGSSAFNWNLLNNGGAADGDDQYFGFTRFASTASLLTLTGGSGTGPARTFSMDGAYTTLVNGNLAETAFSVIRGTLGGTGTVGSTTIASGGTLSPGGDGTIGTLTINGNLVLNAGSTTRFDIGTSAGSSDRIVVTGTASLAGSLNAFATGSFTAGRYTLLTAAGGRTGTFSPLTTMPNAPATLVYDANNVFLDVTSAGSFSLTTSTTESIVFTAPNVTTNRISAFSTQIIGRLLGGTPLYDQTFSAAFADPMVQNGLTAARMAITTAGGPGVIIGDPVRTASSMSSSTTTGATTFALTNTQSTLEAGVVTFGPATLTVGALSTCNVTSLPSSTRPTCTNGGTPLVLGQGDTNANVNTNTVFTVSESRTDTITDTLREVYELNGQVVAVGSVHAEVQSGLFDLGGRLLGRLGQIEQGSAGWAEGYGFRVKQGGRRDALGFAGGFGLQIGEGLTLGLGIDRGRIDIDLPGAVEQARIDLTEIGASLRLDRGPVGASLAVVQGFGDAETTRTIIGNSGADYDVRVTGVAFDMGYTIETGGWTLRPSAGIDYVRISSDGFTESDMLGLVADDQAASRTRATAGLSLGRDFGGFSIAAAARYLAVLDGSERSLPVAFALAPTRQLEMSGPSEPDGALLGARVSVPLAPGASLSFGYDGRFGGGYTAHSGTISVRVSL